MPEMNYNKLLGRIRECEMTQGGLAEAIGISSGQMSQKIQGAFPFKQTEIVRICDVLRIPSDQIGVYFFTPKVEKTQRGITT